MAKEDFCFTYYDGDAARDKAHMNRLERGAYDDIISAQRKRGHLSLDDMKKVLGSDFEKCWGAMEWVLKIDEENKYFIEWVDMSIDKMKKNAARQKEKIQSYWDKKKKENGTVEIPRNNHGINSEQPLEDGNGNEDVNKEFLKGGTGEKFLIPEMFAVFIEHFPDYPADIERDLYPLGKISEFIQKQLNCTGPPGSHFSKVLDEWKRLCPVIQLNDFYQNKPLKTISNNIQVFYQKNGTHRKSSSKSSNSAGAEQLLDSLKADIASYGRGEQDCRA